MKSIFFWCAIALFVLPACRYPSRSFSAQKEPFDTHNIPPAPNYGNPDAWAALADRTEENADKTPFAVESSVAPAADVFFLYPTSFTHKPKDQYVWNAKFDDPSINASTDSGSMLFQASALNGAGKIYAPRYRQAQISIFFTQDQALKKQALDMAYSDIRQAFQFYMSRYNKGRPIIIAAHSQGTIHAARLLKEFFDGKPLQKKLVAAYLIGMPIIEKDFQQLKACHEASETGCLISWRTFATDATPDNSLSESNATPPICTNPLTWKTDTEAADYTQNEGGILRRFDRVFPHLVDARCDADGFLRVHEPKAPIAKVIKFQNYHILDYNLFYINIRNNAKLRVEQYLKGNV